MKTTWTLVLAACISTSALEVDPSIGFLRRVRAAESELEPYLDPNGPYKDEVKLTDGGTLEASLSNCNYTGATNIFRDIIQRVKFRNGTIRENIIISYIEGECTYEDSDGKTGIVSVRSSNVGFDLLINPGAKNVTLLPDIRHGTKGLGIGFLDLPKEMVNFIDDNYEKSIHNLIETLIDKYWD